jgi:hypothetical protein
VHVDGKRSIFGGLLIKGAKGAADECGQRLVRVFQAAMVPVIVCQDVPKSGKLRLLVRFSDTFVFAITFVKLRRKILNLPYSLIYIRV